MAGGHPPLDIGTYGNISVRRVAESRYKARARFRDVDGQTRTVSRFGQDEGSAKKALRRALGDRARAGRVDRNTTVRQLAALWLDSVDTSDRAARTKEHYRYIVERYVLPRIGSVRLSEASTKVCDEALRTISAASKAGARSTRAALNGMFRLAVAHGAMTVNPVRETEPIKSPRTLPRALTREQTEDMSDRLRSEPRALPPIADNPAGLDLVDLVDFMLATGARIGEALACRDGLNADGEPLLNFDAGTWEIDSTVIRLKGRGLLIQLRPKSAAGHRILALPPNVTLMLRGRLEDVRMRPAKVALLNHDGTVREVDGTSCLFPSPFARTLRDPSNTAADLRDILDRLDCPECGGQRTHRQRKGGPEPCPGVGPYASWVRSHTFRKTVATRLDEAGWTGRQAADQLGHSDPSMTLNTYFGRKVANPDAARVLER